MADLLPLRAATSSMDRVAWLIWQGSRRLIEATREGRNDLAVHIGACLSVTREHPRCTPAMRRIIDSALCIALARFGGTAPAFEPAQSDDGEAA